MKIEQKDQKASPALFDVPRFSAEQIQEMQKLQLSFRTSQTRHKFPAVMFKQIVRRTILTGPMVTSSILSSTELASFKLCLRFPSPAPSFLVPTLLS